MQGKLNRTELYQNAIDFEAVATFIDPNWRIQLSTGCHKYNLINFIRKSVPPHKSWANPKLFGT